MLFVNVLLILKYTSVFVELLKEREHLQPAASERTNDYLLGLGKKKVGIFTLRHIPR